MPFELWSEMVFPFPDKLAQVWSFRGTSFFICRMQLFKTTFTLVRNSQTLISSASKTEQKKWQCVYKLGAELQSVAKYFKLGIPTNIYTWLSYRGRVLSGEGKGKLHFASTLSPPCCLAVSMYSTVRCHRITLYLPWIRQNNTLKGRVCPT